ncbi:MULTISPECIES: hypothetical protein [Enterobacteriaceae]|uniref:Uncharacterized protein n=1 Tax=Citrobacter freundii TaxID=546 RepID=A0AAN4EQN4_CITFR|nr:MULTISPECIES: hypothetical protein [Enterobacteriaceae]ELP5616081.1 hypothetical protein [Salmonella enterica]EKU4669575.1 hypothetical protein [Citrobacter freundii]EKW2108031.1 hypothetical protein [Citrobacter freundii]MBJ8837545.1 hypothetical protein [Citrobacter freundii]MBJ8912502.1 hypothetical protein [Citrobacter freundii]
MKIWVIRFLYLAMHIVTGTLDLVGKLLYWSLFATAVGAGLTFGSLLAFLYVIYGG